MRRLLAFALTVALCSLGGAARADKEASLAHYERGKALYRAGRFAEAVPAFERAYELYPAAEYLYNAGQAYRRMNDCRAIAYYWRYLAEEPGSPHRALVEEHIESLSAACREPEPPAEPVRGAPAATAPPVAAAVRRRKRAVGPGPVVLRAEAGLAVYDVGEVVAPTVAAMRLSAGYLVSTGGLEVGGSLSASVTPMRFAADPDGTALFSRALVNVSLGWRPAPRWRLGAEAGAGLLLLSGLADENPFIPGGASAAPLAMFDLRAAASIAFFLGGRYALSLSPVVTRSPGHDELFADIDSIASFSVLAGVGARL